MNDTSLSNAPPILSGISHTAEATLASVSADKMSNLFLDGLSTA